MTTETKFRIPRLPHLPEYKTPQNQADEPQNVKDYREALHRALQDGLIQIDGVLGPGGSGPVSITATTPIVVTPTPLVNTGVSSHATSGVATATYGDATHVSQVAVNATGHVTSASNVAITFPTSGTLQSQEFTTTGANTFNVPTGVTGVWVTMIGGGGGGSCTAASASVGVRGGAGDIAQNMPVSVVS